MQMNFSPPPGLRGDERSSLTQMHAFLFRLTEQLNAALQETDRRIEQTERATGIRQASGNAGGTGSSIPGSMAQQYNDLKSLIIKTASDVRSEMDRVEAQLRSEYIAKSEWGTYEENIRADFEATAAGVVESYGYESRLDSLDDMAADFDSYMIETSGYIKRGIIGYDASNVPIIGIAIGQDIKSTTVTIGGEVYEEIDMTRSLATYTSNRVTFWQNGVEVAWFSNSELVCTNLKIADRITIGDLWEISRSNGFAIKWIGGE